MIDLDEIKTRCIAMCNDALAAIRGINEEIYTVSFWLDVDALVASIGFDTFHQSNQQVAQHNAWTLQHFEEALTDGDYEMASLHVPMLARSVNPAGFAYKEFRSVQLSADSDWDDLGAEQKFKLLQPTIIDVGRHLLAEVRSLPRISKDLCVGVNGPKDWFEFYWLVNLPATITTVSKDANAAKL